MSLVESGSINVAVGSGIPLAVRAGFRPQEFVVYRSGMVDFQSTPKPTPPRPPVTFPNYPKRPDSSRKTPLGKTHPPKKHPPGQKPLWPC